MSFFFVFFPVQVSEIDIYKAFKSFGAICEIAGGGSSKFEVTLRRCAPALRQLQQIVIAGITLDINWSMDYKKYRSPKTDESLGAPPDEHSPNNIMNALGDDCFRAIFEHNILSLEDLLAVANTCERLRDIAQDIVRRKLAKTPLLLQRFVATSELWKIDDFLDIFGESVVSINLNNTIRHLYINMHLIHEYCPHIKEFECTIKNRDRAIQFRPLFSRVKKLNVKIVSDIALDDLLVSNDILECFTIESFRLLLSPIKLSKLTELNLKFRALENKTRFEEFFALNPQLHKLHMNGGHIPLGFQLISCSLNLPHLGDLTLVNMLLEDRNVDVECILFDQMKSLKRLVIGTNGAVASTLRAINKNQLPLKFFSVKASDVVTDRICQIKTIEGLHINSAMNDDQMMQLVNRLEHLVSLHIDSSSSPRDTNVTLNGIERFITTANPLITAKFELLPKKVPEIIAHTNDFKTIQSILLKRNMKVWVRIPSTDPSASLMRVSFFYI